MLADTDSTTRTARMQTRQIPVLLTPDGETAVQDTTDIIDFLERRCDSTHTHLSLSLFRIRRTA